MKTGYVREVELDLVAGRTADLVGAGLRQRDTRDEFAPGRTMPEDVEIDGK